MKFILLGILGLQVINLIYIYKTWRYVKLLVGVLIELPKTKKKIASLLKQLIGFKAPREIDKQEVWNHLKKHYVFFRKEGYK